MSGEDEGARINVMNIFGGVKRHLDLLSPTYRWELGLGILGNSLRTFGDRMLSKFSGQD